MPAATATDQLVLQSITERDKCDGYTVVRCPEASDFWFGNYLVLDSAPNPDTYALWLAAHVDAFPDIPVQRRVIQWETREREPLPPNPGSFEHQQLTVLETRVAPQRTTTLATIDELRGAAWDDALTLQTRDLRETGRESQIAFYGWRFGVYRRDAEAGRCRAWGAWCDGKLVSFAGVYANDDWVRFFNPLTAPEFRRRGIFSALASTALREAFLLHPRAIAVIAAETGSANERLYEHLGFVATGEQHAIIAPV